MRKHLTSAILAFAMLMATTALAEKPSIFMNFGGSKVTGTDIGEKSRFIFSIGGRMALSHATVNGYTFPDRIGLVNYRRAKLESDIQAIDLAFENHTWLGLWQDLRMVLGFGADMETNNPDPGDGTNFMVRFGFFKDVWRNEQQGGKLSIALLNDYVKREFGSYGALLVQVQFTPP